LTQQETYSDSARIAYDAFAPVYDEFNAQNDYEVWLGEVLLPELEKHGLPRPPWDRGGPRLRVLDVGCGTGRAFEPLLRRGFSVHGKDASKGMVDRAAQKLQKMAGQLYEGEMRVGVADARDLAVLQEEGFDLVLLLNDVVNYLTEDGDLERCFRGVERNLAPGGLVCFDANTLGLFASAFVAGGSMNRGEFSWRGLTEELVEGGTFSAEMGGPGLEPQVHRERHWLPEEVNEALVACDLQPLALLGQSEEGPGAPPVLREPLDEQRDYKAIYIGGQRG
jgi:SAM-dependent methyltransferase